MRSLACSFLTRLCSRQGYREKASGANRLLGKPLAALTPAIAKGALAGRDCCDKCISRAISGRVSAIRHVIYRHADICPKSRASYRFALAAAASLSSSAVEFARDDLPHKPPPPPRCCCCCCCSLLHVAPPLARLTAASNTQINASGMQRGDEHGGLASLSRHAVTRGKRGQPPQLCRFFKAAATALNCQRSVRIEEKDDEKRGGGTCV
jgi:hypothetical protein